MAQNKSARAPPLTGTSRLLQNYPMEPIGSRPSYVGELISLVRDGTEEIKYLLEAECDLRFNCKVCGSILPTARAFVIHKRQFCTSKYIDYQRKNVAVMERLSNLVSFEDRSLQTDNLDALELLNPINASLLIPLPVAPLHTNGYAFSDPPNPASGSTPRSDDNEEMSDEAQEVDVPLGVEVVVPARPPVDGVYRFGMGSANLLASRKKKYRTNSMAPPKKKKPKPVLFTFTDEKNCPAPPAAILPKAPPQKVTRVEEPVTSTSSSSSIVEANDTALAPRPTEEVKRGASFAPAVERTPLLPQGHGRTDSPVKRSRRLAGVPHNAEDLNGLGHCSDRNEPKPTPEQSERMKDIRDPRFVRNLLEQLAEVADYASKTCKECNRVVVSIYNLDRHVATQHLGLRECEYSLISKELRRLRQEVYGPLKHEDSQETSEPTLSREVSHVDDVPGEEGKEEEKSDTVDEESNEGEHQNGLDVPTSTNTPSTDSETITERLAAITRNPQAFKEILTAKEKEAVHVDYTLDELVQIHAQILEAADTFLQCCRLCNKQFFDVYVLNRHVMTVHLRLPERSCGTINKLIKEQMKRHPQAFGLAADAEKAAPTTINTTNDASGE
ncbi:zinc finger protein 800-like [Paramacrobiotus metropolitanus]|uniref:zinc finger protein 800-like n=1 Tax=Paramacrobiotus metropolitanus TaxID=2943436 RepID=UPI0024456EFD|nr:zinc finger protein 800-like [Paramacrobiotus metropolitanus]